MKKRGLSLPVIVLIIFSIITTIILLFYLYPFINNLIQKNYNSERGNLQNSINNLPNGSTNNIINEVNNGINTCTPADNPCSSQQCGTILNGTCGTVDCGSCNSTDSCINSVCVSPNCVPNSNQIICGTATCGNKTNNCGIQINCGNCQSGQICSSGKCISNCTPNCVGKTCGDNGCGGSCGLCSSSGKTIFIGVDELTYNSLTLEISRFVQDIKSDTSYSVVLATYQNQTPNLIRNDIKQTYETSILKGIIFIGNIPYKFVTNSPTGDYPSDAFYRDFYNKCDYDSNGNIISNSLWNKCFFGKPLNYNEFWVGRIKPPISGTEGITLLKEYFNRNHGYRTGSVTYSSDMLAYLEILADPSTVDTKITDNFLNSVDQGSLFTRSQVTLLAPTQNQGYNDCSMDTTYLNNLRDKSYKYVFLNAHGSPSMHLCNVWYNNITTISPRAMFYEFRSCSVGDYSKENYLAGWYVFSGGGLVADAGQTVIYGSSIVDTLFDNYLARGLSFGDSKLLNGNGLFSLIGDPTLKMGRTINSNAQISINLSKIGFGNTPTCDYSNTQNCYRGYVYFDISNTGSEDLILPPYYRTAITLYKYSQLVPVNPDLPYFGELKIGNDALNNVTIKPGEKVTASAYFLPPTSGQYSGSFFIISNSKTNPVLEIPFTSTS